MERDVARLLWAQTWQVTLLIGMVAVLSRFLARNRPHLAHALWIVVLVKAITPPVWSSPSGVFSWMQSPPAADAESPETESLEAAPRPDVLSQLSVATSATRISEDLAISDAWAMPSEMRSTVPSVSIDAKNLPAANVPPALGERSTPSRPALSEAWPKLLVISLGVWLAGAAGTLLVMFARWGACRRQIRRAEVISLPALERLFEDLITRLQVRRPVRLMVSTSCLGPAVWGVFRPTILLPFRVLQGKQPADLEPILAHELIHVRRGDLWVGWLQVLAQAVWWFHPLVWWAGRWMKYEAERCCDEEVVAALGCKPSRYARALLDVLELSRVLKPVPVLPGVKPVEITSKRLERIMSLRQGCRKRTPWWCWLVMLLVAAVTLPGAAFVASAKEKDPEKRRARQAERIAARQTQEDESSSRQTRVYPVGDVLSRFKKDLQLNEDKAQELLVNLVKGVAEPAPNNEQTEKPEPAVSLSGKKLTVRETAAIQQRVADYLDQARRHGFESVMIEARIITCPADAPDLEDIEWQMLPPDFPKHKLQSANDFRGETHDSFANGVKMTVEKTTMVRQAVLDESQAAALMKTFQTQARANVIFCPRVRVMTGRTAMVQDAVHRPFVVGLTPENKPMLRVVTEGTTLQLRPTLKDQNRVRLETQLTLSGIRGVEVAKLPANNGDEPKHVQVPEVTTTRVSTAVELPLGQTVVIAGLKPHDGQHDQQLFVALHVRKVDVKADQTGPLPFMFGTGVNSDAGITGTINLKEDQFDTITIPAPSDAAVLHALDNELKSKDIKHLHEMERKNVRIVIEKLSQTAEPPRSYLRIGKVQQHKARFKCTVTFDEVTSSPWPIPIQSVKHTTKVVHLDQIVLVQVDQNAIEPKPWASRGELLEFTATWAGPCRQMSPVVARLKRQGYPVREVDVDREPELAKKYNVKSVPAFVLVVDGQERNRIVGMTSEDQLRRLFSQIPKDPKILPASAESLKDDGQRFTSGPEFLQRAWEPKPVPKRNWRDLSTQKENPLEAALKKPISVTFKEAPLAAVMRELATTGGVNVVVDNLGLEDEGVTADHKVSIEVKDVTLRSVLTLILKPLRLTFLVEDEVLKITSQQRAKGAMTVRTYPVADLVIPMPSRLTVDLRDKDQAARQDVKPPAKEKAPIDFETLTELIVSTVHPDSWTEAGGNGTIRSYETTLSLVIRQTEDVHQEIADLLQQIRRLQDFQVVLEVRTLQADQLPKADWAKKLQSQKPVELDEAEAKSLIQAYQQDVSANVFQAPKMTLFNGQSAYLKLPWFQDKDGLKVKLLPVISADRRAVELYVTLYAQMFPGFTPAWHQVPGPTPTWKQTLRDGHSFVVEVPKPKASPSKNRQVLLITPRIIVQEEEEEALNSPAKIQFGGVTPRIIVQEEEEDLLGIKNP